MVNADGFLEVHPVIICSGFKLQVFARCPKCKRYGQLFCGYYCNDKKGGCGTLVIPPVRAFSPGEEYKREKVIAELQRPSPVLAGSATPHYDRYGG
ncbi:MAG: hypothetical protein HYT39_03255 [Candidatus Sungbacteria bacterium]|nr:hypothetical protein [Candidatus Sungbacteria bacterium]